MKKRTEPTIVERAVQEVDGFGKVQKALYQQVHLRGQSHSTLQNYLRRIALISLHFGRLPELVSDEELTEYLTTLAIEKNLPSRSSFKHMVYGLRYYFRHIGLTQRAVNLPSLKKEAKLPVILNRSKLKDLFCAPTLLKHRIVLTLIYSEGLGGREVINLKISMRSVCWTAGGFIAICFPVCGMCCVRLDIAILEWRVGSFVFSTPGVRT